MVIQAYNAPSRLSIFLKGETVSAFWNFTAKGLGLINTFLTITSLTLYQYGLFQLLLSFSGIPFDFVNLGSSVVSNEISRSISEERISDAKRIFLEYSIIRLLISIIIWAVTFFGSKYFFSSYDIDFVKDMSLISFLFLGEGIFAIVRMFCLVRLEFGIVAFRATINKSIQLVILLIFFIQGNLGLKQLILSIIISSILSVLIILPRFYKIYSKWNNVQATKTFLVKKIFLKYGLWDTLRQFINKITFRIKPWLIKLFIGTEAVAIFSVAEMLIVTLQDILPNNTLQSLVPMWIKDKELSVKMFSYGIKYFFIIGFVIAVFSAIIIPPIVYTYFAKYSESIPFFYLMLTNLPIFGAGIFIGNYVVALRRQKYIFFLHLLRSTLSILIIVCTLPFIGLWGLALDFVLVPLIVSSITYFYTRKRNIGFRFDRKVIFGFGKEDKEILNKIKLIISGWFMKLGFSLR